MAYLIKTRNAADPKTGKVIQHALYDTGFSFQIHRWEQATDSNEIVDEIDYDGYRDRLAARAMAMGNLDSRHRMEIELDKTND